MAKLIITLDGVTVIEALLEKERITIGRSPENDIQLDDITVSGQHAAILMLQDAYVEDLGSTNGTFLNGKQIKKRMLGHNDVIKIGQHELRYVEEDTQDMEATVVIAPESKETLGEKPAAKAFLKILNGPKAGNTLDLHKTYTTLGKPGVQVAVVARRAQGYFVLPVAVGDGKITTTLNDQPIGAKSSVLKTGDVLEVAGARLEFRQEA